MEGEFSNVIFVSETLTFFIILPLFLANLIFRIFNSIFFYANYIENHIKTNTFFSKNLLSHINFCVIAENGLAYLYLFRIYNIITSVLFSLVLMFHYNKYSFVFSGDEYLIFVVYQGNNTNEIKFYNFILCLQINYLFVSLSHFYHYPQFSKIKEIFDSLFLLYDQKIIDTLESDVLNDEEAQLSRVTNEKEALKSNFAKLLINFDPQSELFYRYRNLNFELGGLTEVLFI